MKNFNRTKTAPLKKNIPRKEKFLNKTLFERREREFEEMKFKEKEKHKSKPRKPLYPIKNNFYLTENPFTQLQREANTSAPSQTETNYYTTETEIVKKDLNYLRQIEKYNRTFTESNDTQSKEKMKLKIEAINRKKESVKNFIIKTRELVLMKYKQGVKNERAIRLKETFENEVEAIKDTINSLDQAKKLFNADFYSKFVEYIKHLGKQKEVEKGLEEKLIDTIINYKNDIANIESKIKKIEQEKQNFIKWLYLQIKVKEKIETLPKYYQLIIEGDDNIKKNIIESEIPSLKPNMQLDKKNKDKEGGKIMISGILHLDYERVMKYKNNLIFETADDFLSKLKKIENDNIILIDKYNLLKDEIYELSKEKNKLANEEIKQDYIVDEHLKKKELELESCKDKNNALQKEVNILKMMTKSAKENNKNQFERKKESKRVKSEIKKAKIFSKIFQLKNTLMKIKEHPMQNVNKYSRNSNSTEGEMLIMLRQIELKIDDLFEIFREYEKNKDTYSDLIRKIKNGIEKEHKLEKAKKLQNEQILKLEKVKEQIEERNNRVFFKPKRKIENYQKFIIKKLKKDNNQENQDKEPVLSDFMFDVFSDKKLTRSHSQ